MFWNFEPSFGRVTLPERSEPRGTWRNPSDPPVPSVLFYFYSVWTFFSALINNLKLLMMMMMMTWGEKNKTKMDPSLPVELEPSLLPPHLNLILMCEET